MDIPIIIPAFEPDDRFLEIIKNIIDVDYENVIVVNDGSDADYFCYFDSARQYGCVVLEHGVNKGKGRALKTAFEYVISSYPDAIGVVTADSDGQHIVESIKSIITALVLQPQHLVLDNMK